MASRLRERMEAFKIHKVGQVFNISFTEFLKQPPYVCDLMLEVIHETPEDPNAKELQELVDAMSRGKGKN